MGTEFRGYANNSRIHTPYVLLMERRMYLLFVSLLASTVCTVKCHAIRVRDFLFCLCVNSYIDKSFLLGPYINCSIKNTVWTVEITNQKVTRKFFKICFKDHPLLVCIFSVFFTLS